MKVSEINSSLAASAFVACFAFLSVSCQNRPYTDIEDPYVYGDDYGSRSGAVDPSYSENADVVRIEGDQGTTASAYPSYGSGNAANAPATNSYTPPVTPQPSSSGRSHTVKKGENLYQIGRRYGVGSKDIIRLNGLSSSVIHPNQVLSIP